ncbi:dihydrofolate reductase [Chitinophaga niastensis]|uniref:Dihydrofolate reductase n=2 Tax=Chitinophaga niastensis TaxID=536980 RepID=A0A2P8HGP4_CHINA|nr:dihydrofolate reductase [Chitinophaga niastensis]
MNISLDGFMADPHAALDWHFKSWDEEMARNAYEQLKKMDTILLGRVTYQAMANYWPLLAKYEAANNRDIEYAEMMNSYTKIVFSRTLETVEWKNARLIKENIREEIYTMKQQPGKDMVIYGSGSIVKTLHQLDLIDEYHLLVHPILLGKGKPLFEKAGDKVDMTFLNTKTLSSGVVILNYQLHDHFQLHIC